MFLSDAFTQESPHLISNPKVQRRFQKSPFWVSGILKRSLHEVNQMSAQ
jgi:hypothetical protein